MTEPFAPKQAEFILHSNAKFNFAHGSVRSGKTVCVFFKFLQVAMNCSGDQIWLIGYTLKSIYHNCIRLIFEDPQFVIFRPFCTWMKGDAVLLFGDKKIYCLSAGDEGAIGQIQGKTFDLCYCNEMTLYPENVLQMIISRLSKPTSQMYADMNPVNPDHTCKKMIDMGTNGDPKYYELHFNVEDNIFLEPSFVETLKQTLTGLFYKRNYLGIWCLAEGAIFDFFDRDIHVKRKPRGTTLYWIAGIDYGTDHPFACVLIRVSKIPGGMELFVEKEYYYASRDHKRQKAPSEYARDLQKFFEGYAIKGVYIDPSAALFKAELARLKIAAIPADNEVSDGILCLSSVIKEGTLFISPECPNLIREIQGYVWDPKKARLGYDEPLKEKDDAPDALRYAVKSFMKTRTSLKDTEVEDRFGGSLAGKQPTHDQWNGGLTKIEWPQMR